ncbi:hypothetical protein H920_04921 [Fukomys damarensis]|uniref:Uncharacterized protein n=1 Tax=Fukomys damarensis TaxID=885580 RepID=A0A091EEA2_FUKDA|nr:hypothetical protein H920_04921 [Fukomys damarensis]
MLPCYFTQEGFQNMAVPPPNCWELQSKEDTFKHQQIGWREMCFHMKKQRRKTSPESRGAPSAGNETVLIPVRAPEELQRSYLPMAEEDVTGTSPPTGDLSPDSDTTTFYELRLIGLATPPHSTSALQSLLLGTFSHSFPLSVPRHPHSPQATPPSPLLLHRTPALPLFPQPPNRTELTPTGLPALPSPAYPGEREKQDSEKKAKSSPGLVYLYINNLFGRKCNA